MRIACLYVPLFPLAARLRSEPALRDEPVAIFQGNGPQARLVAATRRARKAGLRRGMTVSQIRALLPDVLVRSRDGECERSAQECLLEVAEMFSPRVEDAGEGVVYLDAQGLELHYSTDTEKKEFPEQMLGQALTLASEKVCLPAWVGIASSKLAARVAAGNPESPTLVAREHEAEFLAPLPISRLSPSADLLTTLRRWGIDTIGALASLPKNEVASRLGADGQQLHERARGIDPCPLVPFQPPPVFNEGMDLDWPLVSLEPFLFLGRTALERLCLRLETRGLACARLVYSLRLEPDGFHQHSILLPAPTRDVKTLLTLMRLDLERQAPGAPVIGFTLTAHPDRPREAQLSLFGPNALSPDRLATSLARLFSLLGEERSGAPSAADEHLPGGFHLRPYTPPAPPRFPAPPRPSNGLLAVRVLRPSIPLEVKCSPRPARPKALRTKTRPATPETTRIQGKVKIASGPWTVEQDWWAGEGDRDPPANRDYWDVELDDGGIYRIYHDRTGGAWYADGIYD